ncbi:hemerythrin domain-containing protein [Muricoccus pecuniae]|uniref:Hemerythrin-like domain-containing protein n=1 Tax=Muricoccus pecuniae TaxID=693023 RepID=A0A840YJQ1_9PROT|nr:hemerythrin domain-containing protein [Roseomonas pecuniae]MBB5694982.1 hypothetical protein [Roseomonas pecuniae]
MNGYGEGEPVGARFCESWRQRAEARIGAVVAEHVVLRALCDRLEAMADGLPGLPPEEERHALARQLTTLLTPHHKREALLLEDLLPEDGAAPMERALLERIRGQHVADAVHAQDLAAVLETASGEGDGQALGYMLRCFFDGCRRALAFEELTILNLARRRFSPRTDALLTACLCAGQEIA